MSVPASRGERPRAWAAATWAVGGLALHVRVTDARLVEPLSGAFAGYEPDPDGEARADVEVVVGLGALPERGLPELPRLALADGRLVDRSEGWDLTIDPGGRIAHAELRLWRHDPALWRVQLEGLVRVVAASSAPLVDGALVHGCALAASPAGAVLFLGASGAGKTTMTRRLPGWTTLADDCAWIERRDGRFYVAGAPFSGKERLPRSGRAHPLLGVVALAPRLDLALAPLPAAQAFFELTSRALWFAPGSPRAAELWALLGAVVDQVPVQRLASSLDDDVAPLIEAAFAPSRGGGGEVSCSAA